jgi:lysophospholipase L1-like esterase
MVRNRYLAAGAALLLVASACSDKVDVVTAPTPGPGGALFRSYVAIGNSITAGFQSAGINGLTQDASYARLVAIQAGTRYAYARINGRGCPPPIINFQTGEGFGNVPAAQRGTTCDLRDPDPKYINAILNNVAVPNAYSVDPTAATSPNSNALTTFILGGKTQIQKAIEADPSFVSIWIGNNDVLGAGGAGIVTATPGVTGGVTPSATFNTNYDKLLTDLRAGATNIDGGILIGVVNVTNIPLLFPADSLLTNATFQTQFRVASGGGAGTPSDLTVLGNCAGSGALVSIAILPQIRLYRSSGGTSGHPPIISCQKNVPAAPVGEIFILDAADQAVITTAVNDYNAHISAKATELNFAYADPNLLLAPLKASGAIFTLPDFTSATNPFGIYVTLDGVHPSAAAHKLVANALIGAINAKYTLTIPAVP